ncbi:MAG: GlsB/YeaQ/YmgE family stress response membrane protein [Pseudomonadota bacterium]
MNFIGFMIIGAAAGFLATRMMNLNLGVPQTIAIGVLGAILGSLVLRILLSVLGVAAGFIGALLGAIVLIWLWKTFLRGR